MVECGHLSLSVQLTNADILKVEPQSWACAVCRSPKSPWLCLFCGVVHCGRYVKGHAKKHAELYPEHSLCIDQGLCIFCYRDDEFIVNDNQVINQLRCHIDQKLNGQPSCDSNQDVGPPPSKIRKCPPPSAEEPVRTGGLTNLGNTCFMNAILQSLNNLEQFCLYFKKLPSLDLKTAAADIKRVHRYQTRQNGSDMDEVSLVDEMRKISCGLWEKESGVYSPDSLFSVLWRLVPRFRGYQQQDAHEFMRYLLDKLHTELVQVGGAKSSSSDEALKKSIVSEIFGGILQSDVTCLTCKCESRTLDPILDISLDISKKDGTESGCQLPDCFGSFTGLETLLDSEWYYCAGCKSRQPSTKQLSLHTLPNVLCLHLKRFYFRAFSRTKINTMVHFPLHGLDLSPYTSSSSKDSSRRRRTRIVYDLAAIVVHHGSGVSSGHYTAYAFSPKSGSWYHFNDSTVLETDADFITRQKAYILFYVQRDGAGKYSSRKGL